MELRSLVSDIKDKVNKLRESVRKPVVGKYDANFDCDLEAQKTFNEIDAIISELESFDQNQKVTTNHAKILTDFLAKRWGRIKNTDLIYPINSEHCVSELCIYIAKYLELHQELTTAPNYLAMLMPGFNSWHNDLSHTDLSTLFLHAFIPNDQNTLCFQIGYLDLNMDELTNTQLEMNMMVGDVRVKLTPAEFNRVYHHSPVVSDYYDLMKNVYQRQVDMMRKGCPKDEINAFMRSQNGAINAAREKLMIAQRTKNYGNRSVRSSYGNEGRETLKNNLLKDIINLFKTREEVFTFMAERLKPHQWNDFYVKMNDNEKFTALIMPHTNINDAAAVKSMFGTNCDYNRAVAYSLVEAYSRVRLVEGEYTSLVGWVGSFFKRVFPKEIKERVIEILKNYLVGDGATRAKNNKYFFTGDMSPEKRQEFSDDEIDLLNAMKNSRVGNIHACICELLSSSDVKPEHRQLNAINAN